MSSVWDTLGLAPTTDKRAIRAAYARQLKSIDQVTQRERFEALRGAYEAALAWAERAEDAPALPHESAWGGHGFAGPFGASSYLQNAGRQDEPPAAATAARYRVADTDIVTLHRAMLDGVEHATAGTLEQRLRDTLAGDALLNLEARERFEAFVLDNLFAPRPFREQWIAAAAAVFEWDRDLRRLPRLGGWSASELHRWLQERHMFEAAAFSGALSLGAPLQWARYFYDRRAFDEPSRMDRARVVAALALMQEAFPTLLRYKFEPELLAFWQEQALLVRDAEREAAARGVGTVPTPRKLPPWMAMLIGFALLMGLYAAIGTRGTVPVATVERGARESKSQVCKALAHLNRPLESGYTEADQRAYIADCLERQGAARVPGQPAGTGLKFPKQLPP